MGQLPQASVTVLQDAYEICCKLEEGWDDLEVVIHHSGRDGVCIVSSSGHVFKIAPFSTAGPSKVIVRACKPNGEVGQSGKRPFHPSNPTHLTRPI